MRSIGLIFFGCYVVLAGIGCASVKEAISERSQQTTAAAASTVRSSYMVSTSSRKSKASAASVQGSRPIVVEKSDLRLADKMTQAMESFVFKSQEKDFKKLCLDKRFECHVDEVLYPAGKKTTKRSMPPFMTGTKMGFQGEKRVQVRYDFYP